MFTSAADLFRTRQCVWDLTKTVGFQMDAVLRFGVTKEDRMAISKVIDAGCLISEPHKSRAYTQLLLAAALPDDDFTGFITSTAVLLANRLQNGGGDDDLFWNWDTFRDHYRLAEAPIKAAIMNGFRMLEVTGRVQLDVLPSEVDCLTLCREDVLSQLAKSGQTQLAQAVISEVSANNAGQLWFDAARGHVGASEISGFRYLYERGVSMRPPHAKNVDLLTWSGC